MDDRQIGARLMTSIQWLLDHDRVDKCNRDFPPIIDIPQLSSLFRRCRS